MSRRPGGNNQMGCVTALLSLGAIVGAGFVAVGLFRMIVRDEGAGSQVVWGAVSFVILLFSAVMSHRIGKRRRLKATSERAAVLHWRDHPHFPKLKTKRGQRGIRLPQQLPLGCQLFFSAVLTLFWNGLTGAALYGILTEKRAFSSDWWIGVGVLSLFVAVGIALIAWFVHTLLKVFLTGSSWPEVSEEPLRPGQRAHVALMQNGSFAVTKLEVTLICQEAVSYRVGTRTTTVSEVVHEDLVCMVENVHARKGLPVAEFKIEIPPDAMHSFWSSNNRVDWFLKVVMDIPKRPDVEENYYLRVAPEVL